MTTATAERLLADHIKVPKPQQPSQQTVYITGLTYENREFTFAREMAVEVAWDGEGWIYEAEQYGINGFARDQQEANFVFRETFDACWEHIAYAEDHELSESARDLKTELRSLVSNTRQIE